MRSVKFLIAAGAATLMSSAAFAADMAIAPPPAYAPPVVEDFGGWYLRGDIGFSNQRVDRLNNALDANNLTSQQKLSFNTAGIFGLGAGYRFNNWFRADVTGEYRGNSQFLGKDSITYAGGFGTDVYHATKSEWVVLANGYVDLGTWWCMTPFIGAGVGGARVAINGFTDLNIPTGGVAYGDNTAKWNFAWALHAGVAYDVTPNFKMELAYRYLNLGEARTGQINCFCGQTFSPIKVKDLESHDIKLGFRWLLGAPVPVAMEMPAPIIRKY